MKNIRFILYSAVALATASVSSCVKQLDEYNPGGSVAEEIWTNPQGFVTAVNAAYTYQRDWYGKEDGMFMGETGTDLWFNRERQNYGNQNTRYEGLSGTAGNFPRNSWPKLWAGINQCNAGIGRIDNAGFTDPVEKNKRLGELRFLRGFYYWHIVESWGGVMLRTKETDSVSLTASRSSIEDFYNVIIGDLEFAKDNLPISWGAEYGRASKKAAMGMLARAYLSRAYYSNGADANAWFTKARDVAQEVIKRKIEFTIDLWATPADLWKPGNNKKNKEALYVVTWSAANPSANNDTKANQTHGMFPMNYVSKPGLVRALEYGRENSRRLMPTLALLDMFNEDIDARYDASFQERYIANTNYTWTTSDVTTYEKDNTVVIAGTTKINVGDVAMVVTKKTLPNKKQLPYVAWDRTDIYGANGSITTSAKNVFFPALKKFIDLSRPTPDVDAGFNDVMVMRLAEMYLISAESDFKLGNLQGAADSINVLRVRAAKPGQADAMKITAGDITTDFILDERARELCGEYIRWFDLKRMLKGEDWVNRIKNKNPDVTAVMDFHRLRPITQVELDALLNGEEFGQNPGYQ